MTIDGGPDVVWLGAAIIIGAGSTSFEMLRYVGDRFLLIPMPPWAHNPMDPISISDVLYYLVAAADAERVPAGSYDIRGPETTTYGDLLSPMRGCRTSGVPECRSRRGHAAGVAGGRADSSRCRVVLPRISLSHLTFR